MVRKFLIGLSCLGWLLLGTLVRAETIVLSTGEYPPYNASDFKHFGLIPRIVKEAFAQEDIEVEFRFYPWSRAYELSKLGKVDGTIQWYHSREREVDHLYSDNIHFETVAWFHLRSTRFEWEELRDVAQYRVGAVEGYTYNEEFYEMIENGVLHVEFVTDDDQNFKKLLIGRIDAVPEVIDSGLYNLYMNYPQSTVAMVTHHTKPFLESATHLLLSRKHDRSERLIEIFNRGLAKLKESGLYDQYVFESRQGLYAPE